MLKRFFLLCICLASYFLQAKAQDSLRVIPADTIIEPLQTRRTVKELEEERKHIPRRATIRSAILPGWGQIYNKKYWKLPIVYTAIGIPVYLYIDNKNWYDKTRFALTVIQNGTGSDPAVLEQVDPKLRFMVERNYENIVRNYRNQFRKNMDYSILYGILMWGLNVVDATVDAHLKEFDISDELSLKIKPTVIPGPGPVPTPGVGFVFSLKNKPTKYSAK
jgi:hypothetical protein